MLHIIITIPCDWEYTLLEIPTDGKFEVPMANSLGNAF